MIQQQALFTTAVGNDDSDTLRNDAVAAVSRQVSTIVMTNMIASVLMAAFAWNAVSTGILVTWLAAQGVLSVGRLAALARWRRRARPSWSTSGWRRFLIISSGISGLLWMVPALVLLPAVDQASQLLIVFITGGFAAGALASLTPILAAYLAWTIPSQLSVFIGLLNSDGPVTGAMTLMYGCFIIAILVLARNANRTFMEQTLLRFEHSRLQSRLGTVEGRLHQAIDTMPAALFLFDGDDRLTLWNQSALQTLPNAAALCQAGTAYATVMENLAVKATWSNEGPIDIKLNDDRWLRLYQNISSDEAGRVIVAIDVTTLKMQESSLRAARDQADSGNRARQRFLSLVSHELRTPLNAVIGFTDLIRDTATDTGSDPRIGDYAQHVHESGTHLLTLIDDMIELSRASSERRGSDRQRSDIADVVHAAADSILPTARAKRIGIDIVLDRDLPMLQSDSRGLRRVLDHLLSNALKFTDPGGSVALSARFGPMGLMITVRDDGIGMDPSDIPHALEPFGRLDQGHDRHTEGAGLGLPMVKTLVEIMSGRLEIRSAPGLGTEVVLLFPPTVLHTRPPESGAIMPR